MTDVGKEFDISGNARRSRGSLRSLRRANEERLLALLLGGGRCTGPPWRGVPFADVGAVVGRVLANLCNLLNPGRIVVGGELSVAGEALLGPMRAAIRRYGLSLVRDVEVVPASLDPGVRAGALGGAALVLSETPRLAAALNRLGGAGEASA